MCQGMFLLPDSTFVLMWAIGKCQDKPDPRKSLSGFLYLFSQRAVLYDCYSL